MECKNIELKVTKFSDVNYKSYTDRKYSELLDRLNIAVIKVGDDSEFDSLIDFLKKKHACLSSVSESKPLDGILILDNSINNKLNFQDLSEEVWDTKYQQQLEKLSEDLYLGINKLRTDKVTHVLAITHGYGENLISNTFKGALESMMMGCALRFSSKGTMSNVIEVENNVKDYFDLVAYLLSCKANNITGQIL